MVFHSGPSHGPESWQSAVSKTWVWNPFFPSSQGGYGCSELPNGVAKRPWSAKLLRCLKHSFLRIALEKPFSVNSEGLLWRKETSPGQFLSIFQRDGELLCLHFSHIPSSILPVRHFLIYARSHSEKMWGPFFLDVCISACTASREVLTACIWTVFSRSFADPAASEVISGVFLSSKWPMRLHTTT